MPHLDPPSTLYKTLDPHFYGTIHPYLRVVGGSWDHRRSQGPRLEGLSSGATETRAGCRLEPGVCLCVCVCVCMYRPTCSIQYLCLSICAYIYIYIYVCIYIYIYMYTYSVLSCLIRLYTSILAIFVSTIPRYKKIPSYHIKLWFN